MLKPKLKLLTILLAVSTILLGVLTFYFYLESEICTQVIADRELTITNYKKVINAIGRCGGVPVDNLKNELKKDFEINDKIEYYDYSKEFY